jgi:hypothetical protein
MGEEESERRRVSALVYLALSRSRCTEVCWLIARPSGCPAADHQNCIDADFNRCLFLFLSGC